MVRCISVTDFDWFRQGADPFRRQPVDVVVTYEGGGARGIWHLGALRVLEASRREGEKDYEALPIYNVLGVNGTSMGGLVASLQAVGYQAHQMLDLTPTNSSAPGNGWFSKLVQVFDRRKTPLQRNTGSIVLENAGVAQLINLFNRRQRLAIRMVSASKSRSRFVNLTLPLLAVNMVLFPVALLIGFMWFYRLGPEQHLQAALLASLVFAFAVWKTIRHGLSGLVAGLGSAARLADRLDLCFAVPMKGYDDAKIKELHKQIKSRKYTRTVTFADLDDYIKRVDNGTALPAGFGKPISLALIASNITTGRLEKFSINNTPKVLIAEAVAASCSIPILFKPFRMKKAEKINNQEVLADNYYVDGAITSNFPVWTSDMARAANPDLIAMSFGTISNIRYPLRNFAERVGALVNTAMFGSGPLETRRTRNAAFVHEPNANNPVGLLDFDMDYDRASTEINRAERVVRGQIDVRARRRETHGNAARNLAIGLADLTKTGRAIRGGPANVTRPNIRVSLLRPVNFGQNGLKKYQVYSSNPDAEHVDNEMTFDGSHSLPGKAWNDKAPAKLLHIAELMTLGKFDSRKLMWRMAPNGETVAVDRRLSYCCWQSQWAMSRRLDMEPPGEEVGSQLHVRNPRWMVVLVEADISLMDIAVGANPDVADRGLDVARLSQDLRLLTLFDEYELAVEKWNVDQLQALEEFVERSTQE